MHPTAAFAVEAQDSALADLRAEVQASLALNRAVLQTLATLSPTLAVVAERALEDELQFARQAGASPYAVELIEDAREQLRDGSGEADLMTGLELALIAAADALPELRVRHEA